MRQIITIIMAVTTLISASAHTYSYKFNNTPISEAILTISKENPDINISFIYKELDNYRTSSKIQTDDVYEALRSTIGVNPISLIKKDDHYYIEALQHGNYMLTGRVIDTETEPVAAGVIYIISADGTKQLTYGITDINGYFRIPYDSKDATMKISYLGYEDFTMPVPDSGNCGVITLTPHSVKLGEVVVKSARPVIAIKGDALVTTIEGTYLEHAGTANDVLPHIPMVTGRDGAFEVFGKGAPAIYVNGRLLRDTDELQQINSSDIKTIEVITNPGVKYDASVKSVIRIKTKRPQGEGFSGVLRTTLRSHRYLSNINQINLKYRTGGLEVFAVMGEANAKFQSNQIDNILTHSTQLWEERITQNGYGNVTDAFGKAGFSYLFNENHSIGAYYSNGLRLDKAHHVHNTEMLSDGEFYDRSESIRSANNKTMPRHSANLYYNGKIKDLEIDFNTDYLWNKSRFPVTVDEVSENEENSLITSLGVSRSRMFAEKLIVSYPIWKGEIEIGEEFVSSRFSTDYTTDAEIINDASTRVSERNMAAFVELKQSFGCINVGAGIRYEHVKFDYLENGQKNEDQSKNYNNAFPALSLSSNIGSAQLSLSYTGKTQRPNYHDLDGTIDYINRFTLQGGNPYLKPEKIHTTELTGVWNRIFAQLSYTLKKDPIIPVSQPYGELGEIKLMTNDNFPRIHSIRAFIGTRFNVGIWEPSVNLGLTKQWFTVDTWNGRRHLNNPQGMVQWQNAIHLPYDMWLNVDVAWESAGNELNIKREHSSYMNAKLYKAFLNNNLSVSFETNDIFNTRNYGVTVISRDITRYERCTDLSRMFYLQVQYKFNTSRDRYKGKGAGTNEKNRF
ncbi:MAG: TonB-dependent receptor [Barnesiella sp.]|nr:TonB-dependent receptor [Barnesiella sp.]